MRNIFMQQTVVFSEAQSMSLRAGIVALAILMVGCDGSGYRQSSSNSSASTITESSIAISSLSDHSSSEASSISRSSVQASSAAATFAPSYPAGDRIYMGAFVDRDWADDNRCGDKITSAEEWDDNEQWYGNTNPYFAKIFPEWFLPDGGYQYYSAWKIEIAKIKEQGRIPYINWEAHGETQTGLCWWTGTERISRNIIAEINHGDHDAFIADLANGLHDEKIKIVVDLFHEMNGNWYDWSPCKHQGMTWQHWREAYKRIVDIFRGKRAPFIEPARNVEFATSVWFQKPDQSHSEPWFCEDTDAGVPTITGDIYIEGYMDWVGIDIYGGESFAASLDIWYDELAATGKPIVIGEMSVPPSDQKAAWLRGFQYAILNDYPAVKAFNWFDINKNSENVNWQIDAGGTGPLFDELMLDPRLVGAFGVFEMQSNVFDHCVAFNGKGAPQLQACDGSAGQTLTLTDLGDYLMEVRDLESAHCLASDAATVLHVQCDASSAQLWRMAVQSWQPLLVKWVSTNDQCLAGVEGLRLTLADCADAAAEWRLVKR